jgi:hypothetical protein
MWVETVMNYSEALSQQLSGGTEENSKISVKREGFQIKIQTWDFLNIRIEY